MKIKVNNEQMEGIINALSTATNQIATADSYSDDQDIDNLVLATLEEMRLHCQVKFFKKKEKYSLTIKPNWGFALRWFFNCLDREGYEINLMAMLSDKVHETYSTKKIILSQ